MANTVNSMDMLVKPAVQKGQGDRKAGKTEDGFQKLLGSKAQEDMTSAGDITSEKQAETVENTKEQPAADTEKEEPRTEGTIPSECVAEQIPAALLFQIKPCPVTELPTEAAGPVAEAVTVAEPVQEAEPSMPVQTEEREPILRREVRLPEEKLPGSRELLTETAEEKAELPVLPRGTGRPEAETAGKAGTTEKPKRSEEKAEPVQTARTEEPVQNMQPQVNPVRVSTERTEVPAERITVQRPAELPEQLGNLISTRVSQGKQELEVQIEPYDLGRILIKVAVDREKVAVSIICNEPKTMELLSKNVKSIGMILESRLGEPTVIYVEDKEPGYLDQQRSGSGGSGYEQSQEQQQKQNGKSRRDESVDFLQQLRLGLI